MLGYSPRNYISNVIISQKSTICLGKSLEKSRMLKFLETWENAILVKY
jgi:hypothetical protein